jgi:leucyl aminopeptidase
MKIKMISDMGGAANVVGALQAVASLGLPLVIFILF